MDHCFYFSSLRRRRRRLWGKHSVQLLLGSWCQETLLCLGGVREETEITSSVHFKAVAPALSSQTVLGIFKEIVCVSCFQSRSESTVGLILQFLQSWFNGRTLTPSLEQWAPCTWKTKLLVLTVGTEEVSPCGNANWARSMDNTTEHCLQCLKVSCATLTLLVHQWSLYLPMPSQPPACYHYLWTSKI